jgi:pimeloyl-ACP methyl ester carboxylesterase
VDRECADLSALLSKTGARDVLGLSSGALIVLWAALSNPSIRRVVLYEPSFPIADLSRVDWAPRFDEEIARWELAFERIELAGVGHVAADNDGKPQLVARELRRFLERPATETPGS